jgi:outer membrane protein TolC
VKRRCGLSLHTKGLLGIAVAACLLIGSASGWAQERLSIESAIQRSLVHNRELALSALGVHQAELSRMDAQTGFDVSVKPNGDLGTSKEGREWQYGLASQKKTLWGTQLGADTGVAGFGGDTSGSNVTASVRVELTQPLFRNFGPLINAESVVAADDRLNAEQRRWEQQKEDLVVEVVRTFENLILLEKQIRTDEAFRERMDKLYELTQARERLGRTTKVDSLRVELQRGQASARLESNREKRQVLMQDFAELLGLPLESEFALDPPPLLDIAILPVQEAVRTALQNRMDYAQVLQDSQTAERQSRIAQRGLYPDLNFVSWYRRFGEGRGTTDSLDLNGDDWFVGLAGDVDLNRHRARLAVIQADSGIESAKASAEIRRIGITREVQQALSDYRRALTDMGIAERNAKLAGARAELARSLFRSGRGDNFSVTDAEDASAQAEAALLTAHMDSSVNAYALLRSLGILIDHPASLKPPKMDGVP